MASRRCATVWTLLQILCLATHSLAASIDQQTTTTTRSPFRLPIFRETEDFSIDYTTLANKIPADKVDSATYLDLSEAVLWRLSLHRYLIDINRALSKESMELHEFDLARAKMISVLEIYRTGREPTSLQKPALQMGATMRPQEPPGANINNYAPDNFSPLELMRMFHVSNGLRLGRVKLDSEEQKGQNEQLRENYVLALAGIPSAIECVSPGGAEEEEECAICRDCLSLKLSIKLPCQHAYHRDCVTEWNRARTRKYVHSMCPLCRQLYRMPFGSIGLESKSNIS